MDGRAEPPTAEEVDALQAFAFVVLNQLTECCPNRSVRMAAKVELMAPTYDRDWEIERRVDKARSVALLAAPPKPRRWRQH
jgi:hypothetical protein